MNQCARKSSFVRALLRRIALATAVGRAGLSGRPVREHGTHSANAVKLSPSVNVHMNLRRVMLDMH